MTIIAELKPDQKCPCCSGLDYETCCGQYLSGKAHPPTAEAVMRSRYTAYATGEIEYLLKTLPLLDRKNFDRRGAKQWSEQAEWTGLEVISVKEMNQGTKATVEFKAKFKINNESVEHHEISRFEKQMGRWFLIDGKIIEKD